jgi:REP element-mobilizing transposase RayT
MPFNSDIHHRRSIRLRGYDYTAAGAYFVTICAFQRECLFGSVQAETMVVNDAGGIIEETWYRLPRRFPSIVLDECIVMPNHFHGIVLIEGGHEATSGAAANSGAAGGVPSLGMIIRAFKSISAVEVNLVIGRQGSPLWQRNYYEHILRSERDLEVIRRYITDNPRNWAEDVENPVNVPQNRM